MLNPKSQILLPRDPHEGFSDEELLRLSRLQRRTEAGYAPWASWEAENSSFGRTLREWAGYPSCLPLCVTSDHGVHWESHSSPTKLSRHTRCS